MHTIGGKHKETHHKHHKHKSDKKREHHKSKRRRRSASSDESESSAAPHLSVYGGVCTAAAEEPAAAGPSRSIGAQRPEEAASERERLQKIHKVFDPSLGVERYVRASGEVVEQCVSREEQHATMRAKAAHVPTAAQAYTGKTAFPSQHPWFGFK